MAKRTAAAAIAALAAALSAGAVEIDGVAAKVGSETILRSDVAAELRRMGESDASRFDEVRNAMIDRKLVLKAAEDSKMTMQDWVVEGRVRDIVMRAFGGDRNRLLESLARQRVTYAEWRSRIKEDMVVAAMRWNVIDKNVSASPAEMRKEFDSHRARYANPATVDVSAIMLEPGDAGRRDAISKQAATNGFESCGARKYAGAKPEETFAPPVAEAVARLKPGETSPWIEIDGWSFLVRKDAEKPGSPRTFEEAYADVEAAVKEAKGAKAYADWMERLRAETYIKVY